MIAHLPRRSCCPFAVWTLRGFIIGHPEGARGGGDGRRLEPARRLRADPASARRAGPRRDRRCSRSSRAGTSTSSPTSSSATSRTRRSPSGSRTSTARAANTDWGALMAASTLTAIPVVDLLPARPAEDRLRPHRRRQSSVMSELERLASSCILPASRASTAPDWLPPRLDEGLGGVVLYACNVESREQLAALTRRLRVRASTTRRRDRRGGRRRDAARGGDREPLSGNAALGVVDDVDAHASASRLRSAPSSPTSASTSTSRRSRTSTRTPQNPVIGIRSFGLTASSSARHVAAFVRGLQSAGVRPRARSTFPATATPPSTRTSRCPVVDALERGRARPVPCRDRGRSAVDHDRAHRRPLGRGDARDHEPRDHFTTCSASSSASRALVVTDALEMKAISATVGSRGGRRASDPPPAPTRSASATTF